MTGRRRPLDWVRLLVKEQADLTPSVVLIAYALAAHSRQVAHGPLSMSNVSVDQLCQRTHLSRRSVTYGLKELAAHGWLAPVKKRTKSGRQAATDYYLTTPESAGGKPVDNSHQSATIAPWTGSQSATIAPRESESEHDQSATIAPLQGKSIQGSQSAPNNANAASVEKLINDIASNLPNLRKASA